MRFLTTALLILTLFNSAAHAGMREELRAIFAQDHSTIDVGRIKLTIDKIIHRSINVERELATIDQMAATIKRMLPEGADEYIKIEAIRQYIYEPSAWNNYKVFSYDLDDPYGQDPSNRILSRYLHDRRGNCITMPFLFVILGQRLGLDVKPALAPLHVFVKFTDSQGITKNIEATSGGYFARDVYYRGVFPITDLAVSNGVYMRSLSNEETIAAIAVVLVEELIRQERYQEAIGVAEEILGHFPTFVYALIKKGTAAYYLLKTEFRSKYKTAAEIPISKHDYFRYLQRINKTSFDRADSLGWKAMDIPTNVKP